MIHFGFNKKAKPSKAILFYLWAAKITDFFYLE